MTAALLAGTGLLAPTPTELRSDLALSRMLTAELVLPVILLLAEVLIELPFTSLPAFELVAGVVTGLLFARLPLWLDTLLEGAGELPLPTPIPPELCWGWLIQCSAQI